MGNRADSADATGWVYDGNNRIVQHPGLSYGFDEDGNLTLTQRSDGAAFAYNPDQRLVQYTKGTTSANYAYDPFGRRITKTVNGVTTWFLWDGERLLREYDGAGNPIRRYAYLPGRYAPAEMADGNGTYAIHTDHLDTPRRATGAGQQVVWSAAYEAYGNALVDEDPDGNGQAVVVNIRFPGQYYDAETGLYYNYFRYYDPSVGRYITSDPIGLGGGLNIYVYVDNNPIKFFDQDGLLPGMPWPFKDGPFGTVCGTGLYATSIPDGYFTADFSRACKRHDDCYGTCNRSKDSCDKDLLSDLKRACGGIANFTCMAVARGYYDAVRRFGGGPHRKAQDQDCKFCSK